MPLFKKKSERKKKHSEQMAKESPAALDLAQNGRIQSAEAAATLTALATTPAQATTPSSRPAPVPRLHHSSSPSADDSDLGTSSDVAGLNLKSRLHSTLSDMIFDSESLPYVLQYLEGQGLANLLHFWLAAQNFATTAWSLSRQQTPSPGPGHITEIEQDAASVYQTYLSPDAKQPIQILPELKKDTIDKICPADRQRIDPDCFKSCQEEVFRIMEKEHFANFLRSDDYCKYQIDVLTSGKVNLADVLNNDSAMFYFREYMDQEGGSILLQFWMAADNFSQLRNSNQEEVQQDAMVIYDRFFSLQALTPLGLGDAVRFEVECNICKEEGPAPDCFATPMKIAVKKLQQEFLPGFLTHDLYTKFLSELINTASAMQRGGAGPPPPSPGGQSAGSGGGGGSRRRAGSDTSSQHSLPVANTLLAEGSVQRSQVTYHLDKVDDDMRIDADLFDPENLWQRPHAGGMSIGRMNELGRFVGEYEGPPASKGGSGSAASTTHKLSQAFKKMVTNNEGQAKQDMAWQVAEMIVKNITEEVNEN